MYPWGIRRDAPHRYVHLEFLGFHGHVIIACQREWGLETQEHESNVAVTRDLVNQRLRMIDGPFRAVQLMLELDQRFVGQFLATPGRHSSHGWHREPQPFWTIDVPGGGYFHVADGHVVANAPIFIRSLPRTEKVH